MMFEAMFFLFCPIHIKHQTFNFKLKKRGCRIMRFLLNAISSFCAQRLYQYPYFVLPSIVGLRNRKAIKELSLWPFFIIMEV